VCAFEENLKKDLLTAMKNYVMNERPPLTFRIKDSAAAKWFAASSDNCAQVGIKEMHDEPNSWCRNINFPCTRNCNSDTTGCSLAPDCTVLLRLDATFSCITDPLVLL
jgi:hypothetical protein